MASAATKWNGTNFLVGLAAQGAGVLIYDARGHSESIHQNGKADLSYKEFQTAEQWDKMPNDLASAVEMLKKQLQPVRTPFGRRRSQSGGECRVGLYGNSIRIFWALVLLSPGLRYASIDSEEAFHHYGERHVFMAASPDDSLCV